MQRKMSIRFIAGFLTAFFFFLFLSSCKKKITKIPKEFSGKWTETSDDIILGRTPPRYLNVTDKNVVISQINEDEEMISDSNDVQLIEKDGDNKLILTCKKYKGLTNEITIIYKDGFIYATEYMHSSVPSEDDRGSSNSLGKFYQ